MLSNKWVKIGCSTDTTSLTLKMGLKSWNWLFSELWGTWNIIKVLVQVSGAASRWEVPKQAWCKCATGAYKSGFVDRPIQKDPKSVFLQRPKPDWSQEYVRTFCVLLYRPNAFAMPNTQRVPGSMCIYWSQPHVYSSVLGMIGWFPYDENWCKYIYFCWYCHCAHLPHVCRWCSCPFKHCFLLVVFVGFV